MTHFGFFLNNLKSGDTTNLIDDKFIPKEASYT